MIVEPLSPTALRPVRRAVFAQQWLDLAFLHWPVNPALVAPLLPRGTVPDVHDGVTWVGLVPFTMAGVRIFGSPPLPHLSRFLEMNVRLYAVDGEGRRGVVFRSLEADRLLPVLSARVSYHLPYLWARMTLASDGPLRTWTSSRRWPGPSGAGAEVSLRIGDPLVPGDLEHFLTARWGLFSTWYGDRTAWAPVEHEPWPLHSAEVLDLREDLVAEAGLHVEGPPHVMWSPGVSVRIGRPTRLRA